MSLPLAAYGLVSTLLHPFAALWLRQRTARGKEDRTRLPERLGHARGLARPAGDLLWAHAASVGESQAVLPLLKELRATHPGLPILLTTGTKTSAQFVSGKLPEGVLHRMAPLDTFPSVTRFLNHWQPSRLLLVESELWPVWLWALGRRHVPVAVVNGRMSEKSYAMWGRLHALAKPMMRYVSLVLAQDGPDGDRFRALGAEDVHVTGNIKWDTPPLPASESELERLRAAIGRRSVWVAASTHAGEESQLAEAHALIRQHVKNALLILAPRHPHRGNQLVADLREAGFNLAQRSQSEPITAKTEIYLADTMGELGLWYRLAQLAFVGGSLVVHGGQNPLEPARLGCPVIAGWDMHNFASITLALEQSGALERTPTPAAVAESVLHHFQNKTYLVARRKAALESAGSQSGAIARTMRHVQQWLASPVALP
ncbi:3-deoxy-D-manno-octulosonic acid transferase [bacterium]|nr:3-deoxy-D-manno-octulosonic acid transferase [bacterium]